MDNVNIEDVWIQILNSNDTEIENVSMIGMNFVESYWYENTYSAIGNYKYRIWVKDSSSNWASAEGSFTIRDTTSPVANAGADQEFLQGTMVIFDGTGSSDNDKIDNYTWTFNYKGEEISLFGIGPTFKFEAIGNYAVILRIMDPSSNSAEDVLLINVTGMDSDGDGLTDYDEVHIFGTMPNDPDTDNDDVNDGDEVALGTDPLKPGKPKETEESFLESYWWLYLIIAVIMTVLLLFLLFKKKGEITKEDAIEEKQSEPETKDEPEEPAPLTSSPQEIEGGED